MAAESRNLIVVGRDARVSGPMVRSLVCATLTSLGFDVADRRLPRPISPWLWMLSTPWAA